MWNDTDLPLEYLITFRCYGTWLHGDERRSIDRFHNRYKSPYTAKLATYGVKIVGGGEKMVIGSVKVATRGVKTSTYGVKIATCSAKTSAYSVQPSTCSRKIAKNSAETSK